MFSKSLPTMTQLADHIIAVANNISEDISNLKLQIVMYYAFCYAIKQAKHHRMFKTSALKGMLRRNPFIMKSGAFCPKIEPIWHHYKIYGASPIQDFTRPSLYFNQIPFNAEIIGLLQKNPFDLIQEIPKDRKYIKCTFK